jgi:hypothetical protein
MLITAKNVSNEVMKRLTLAKKLKAMKRLMLHPIGSSLLLPSSGNLYHSVWV